MQTAIDDYLLSLQTEKRFSDHTFNNYRRDLTRLLAFCHDKKLSSWPAVQTNHIRSYIAQRHRSGMKSKTLQRELSSFRSFFKFLLKHNRIQHNPATTVQAPKQARPLPKTLNVDQISGMLEHRPETTLEQRDLAIFELFYSCGLRLSELAALNIADIDFHEQSLVVRHGKGGKQRHLPVGSKAIQALEKWLGLRTNTDDALFTSIRGTRLNVRSIQIRLERWCRKIGIPEHVHPHMLRHSFASHMLESSQDIRAVQELLGHSNISTTQIYTHLDFQHLAEVYDRTHPRARKKS